MEVELKGGNTAKQFSFFTYSMDVSSHSAFSSFFEFFKSREQKIDFLFNNAGIGVGGEVIHFEMHDWKKIIEVNLYGVIHGVHFFYPMMVRQKSGTIINTSSLAGLVPLPGEASYVASKYAVQGLTEALAIEASFHNIHVLAVCPGVVQTPIYDTGKVIGMDKDAILKLWPKGIEPDECAAIILRAVVKKKKRVVITAFGKMLFYLNRFFPGIARMILTRYFKEAKSKSSNAVL